LKGERGHWEDPEEAIAAAVDLDTPEACDLRPHDCALLVQQAMPRAIAQALDELR
jgi:hypothetical protein